MPDGIDQQAPSFSGFLDWLSGNVQMPNLRWPFMPWQSPWGPQAPWASSTAPTAPAAQRWQPAPTLWPTQFGPSFPEGFEPPVIPFKPGLTFVLNDTQGGLYLDEAGNYFDVSGNPVSQEEGLRRRTAAAGPEPMSAWQESQVRLAREQFEWQQQQAQAQMAFQQAQLRAGQAGTEEQERLQMQQAMLRMLQDISAHPRNWIQAHFARQILHQLGSLMQEGRGVQEQWKVTDPAAFEQELANQAMVASRGFPSEVGIEGPGPQRQVGQGAAFPSVMPTTESVIGALAARGEGVVATGGGGGGPLPIGPPKTPAWLTEFVPSLTVGQPIAKGEVTPPSAQQFTGMPWTAQQKLAGFLDWAKGVGAWQNLQEQIARSIPQAPTLGRRWTPPRQFA